MGALAIGQPLGGGDLLELRARRREPFRRPRDGLALERNAGVQLKGAVLDLEVVVLTQLVDPSLADVTPRSNEVAEDEQPSGHVHSV